jgi:inhibitor of cysteine peptidase
MNPGLQEVAMYKKVICIFVLFGLLIVIGTCTILAPVSQSALSVEDEGKTVKVKVGNQLNVSLDGNPSTGYHWEVGPGGSTLLEQVGEAEFASDNNAVGSPGKVTLTFKAVKPGEETLQLVYHQPWETGAAPLKTFEVNIQAE